MTEGLWTYLCVCVCVPDVPPEDGKKIVTETCRVLIYVFYKHF